MITLDCAVVQAALAKYEGAAGVLNIWSLPSKLSYSFDTTADGIRQAVNAVAQLDAAGEHSIYHGGTTLREPVPSRERGRNDRAWRWLRVQLDVDHGKPGYAPDAETAIRLVLAANVPPPSTFVDSGHGVYPQWEFEQTVSDSANVHALVADMAAEIRQTFAAAGYALDRGMGIDPARVWRIPGTVNRKHPDAPVLCRMLPEHTTGAVYSFDVLHAAVPHDARPASTPPRPTGKPRLFTRDQADDFVAKRLDDLRTAPTGHINDALNTAAKMVSHFVPTFLDEQGARDFLLDALRENPAYDGNDTHSLSTIRSALGSRGGDWTAELVEDGAATSLPAAAVVRLPILPPDFWAARPVLVHIRQAAHALLVSADLVLHAVMAKLSSMRSHELYLDSGRRGSLNYFAATVGPSGAGKTTGAAVVHELLDTPKWLIASLDGKDADPFHDGMPLGSGEGIAELFMGEREVQVGEKKNGDPIMKAVRAVVRHNAYLMLDEGEAFTRFGERTGNNTAAALRSAWVGETIGQFNSREETRRVVKRGDYALGMVIGLQPTTALPLLEDTATGTAQRFAWVSAVDPTIPDEPVEFPGRLAVDLTDGTFANTPRTGAIRFPDEIVAQLRAEHLAKVRGEVEVAERDSQGPLMRCKAAALLGLLDSRGEVNTEDWQLASVMWDTSCAFRDTLVAIGQKTKAAAAEQKAAARVQIAERTAAVVSQVDSKLTRLATTLAQHVVNTGGLQRSAARKTMASRDRQLYDSVVEHAEALGLLRQTPDGALQPPRVDA